MPELRTRSGHGPVELRLLTLAEANLPSRLKQQLRARVQEPGRYPILVIRLTLTRSSRRLLGVLSGRGGEYDPDI